MEDERHPLDELLVGADHAVQPPAVVLAPGVVGGERIAVFVDWFRPAERRRAGGAGEAEDDLTQRLPGQRLGLAGGGAKARAPQQAVRLGERDRRAERCDRGGGGCGRRGWGARQRDWKRAMRLGRMVDVLAALVLVPALVVLGVLVVRLVMLLCVGAGTLSGAFRRSGVRLHRSGAVFARGRAWRRWTMGKYLGRGGEVLCRAWRVIDGCRIRSAAPYAGSFASERHR